MRTYAPADTSTVLERLLEEPSLARGVVHHAVIPPREAAYAGIPAVAGPADRRRARGSRDPSLYTPPGARRSRRSMPARTSSSSPRRRRARRCATRCRSSRRSRRIRRRGRCSCSRPRRSARTRWRSSASSPAAAGLSIIAATYDGDTPAPIRSAIRAAGQVVVTNPDMLHSRDPPPPHEVVPAVRAAPGHRHRRAAHVPRRVRQPRRQRPAPAAPDLRPLRQQPDHRVLLRDDREPARARGDADRPTGTAHRPQRRAGRRAARPARRPAGPGAGEWRARLGGARWPSAGRCRSCAPAARRSSSGGRGSRSRSC